FFQKHHGGANHRLMKTALQTAVLKTDVLKNEILKPEAAGTLHRYAHAYQNVNNYGGASWLNLWDPTPTNHQFSLSQQWYVGGSPVQTIEGGWQVYPDLYGH